MGNLAFIWNCNTIRYHSGLILDAGTWFFKKLAYALPIPLRLPGNSNFNNDDNFFKL